MLKWVDKVFLNKVIMSVLAKYIDIKTVLKLAQVSRKLYYPWKENEDGY